MPYHKTLSRILKSALSYLKKIPYKKKPNQESKKGALSRNLKTIVRSILARIYTKYLKKKYKKNLIMNLKSCLIKEPIN